MRTLPMILRGWLWRRKHGFKGRRYTSRRDYFLGEGLTEEEVKAIGEREGRPVR